MRAVTRPLDREVDLNGFARGDGFLFVRDGVGLAGRGVAARVPVAEVAGALAAIERDDTVGRPGCGPIALGVFPFRPSDGTQLVIPAVTIGKGPDGDRWITTIDGAEADLEPPPAPTARAGAFSVVPGVPVETYLACGRSRPRRGAGRPPHQGRHRPRRAGGGRPPARRPRHPPAAAGLVRLELPVLRGRLRRRLT